MFDREVDALKKLPKVLPCEQRIILTYEEETTIVDDFGTNESRLKAVFVLNLTTD